MDFIASIKYFIFGIFSAGIFIYWYFVM